MKLRDLIQSGYLFLDGAMGTELQAAGLKLGERPELLCSPTRTRWPPSTDGTFRQAAG